MIRAGFFNAMKDVDGNFDRVYNNEDFTSFLRGIINQNGVFYNIWECCRIYANNNMNISVSRGKGIIYGHWFEVSSIEPVEIATPDPVFDRIDAIIVYLDLNDRSIKIMDLQGTPATNPQKPFVFGYDENTHEFEPNMGVVQMTLGYIRVRANATQITDADIIEHCVGTYACPWISQLTYDPNDQNMRNVDKFLAEFQDKFVKWFDDVQDTLQINMHINYFTYSVSDARDAWRYVIPSSKYRYIEGDDIIVFKNGIKLDSTEYELSTMSDPSTGLPSLCIEMFPGAATIYPNQLMEVHIIRGSAMDYPNIQDVL